MSRQIKILFTVGGFGRGGKERRLISLMEFLKPRDFELAIIANRNSPNLPEVAPYCRNVYDYRTGDCLFNIREHRRAVEEFHPDLIHSWNGSNTLYAILAARGNGCRIVTSEITNARLMPIFSKEYWMTRLNFRFADSVLSNSAAGLRAKAAPQRKAQVIYNGYRRDRLDTIDREKYRHLGNLEGLKVVMAARFSREKDYGTVLGAAEMAQAAGLQMTFVLAGEGPDLETIREAASEAGLSNVRFPGHVPDIDNLLHHMDVGVLATDVRYHQEGISNSVIEYMAHGIPAIVTEGAAVSEILSDGTNGYVVAGRSPDRLVEKLITLMKDRALLKKMGANARRTVADRFDLDQMGECFVRLYRQVGDFS